MSEYFHERDIRQKVKELQAEGLMSQAYYSSRPARVGLLKGWLAKMLSHLGPRPAEEKRTLKKIASDAVQTEA